MEGEGGVGGGVVTPCTAIHRLQGVWSYSGGARLTCTPTLSRICNNNNNNTNHNVTLLLYWSSPDTEMMSGSNNLLITQGPTS